METATKADIEELKKMISSLRDEMVDLKNNFIDEDTILSDEDKIAIIEAEKEFENGETQSLEDFNNKLENE